MSIRIGRHGFAGLTAVVLVAVAAGCAQDDDGSADQSDATSAPATAASSTAPTSTAASVDTTAPTTDAPPTTPAPTTAPATTTPDVTTTAVPPTLPFELDISGSWATDYGELALAIDGDQVTGTYPGFPGGIDATFDGATMTGTWFGDDSEQPCGTERLGTVNWGLIEFEFDPVGYSFTGVWSYCDEPLTLAWNGNRSLDLDPIDTAGDRSPDPPLVSAVFDDDLAELERLLAAGEDPNVAEDRKGWTPLLVAAQEGNTDIARALIAAGADIDRGSDDDWTPLMIAAQNGHDDTLAVLIDAGANPRVARASNWTPLHSAVTNENIGATRLLIEAGVPLEAATKGFTVLTAAADDGLEAFVTLLIDAGASVRGAGVEGPSPLYMAAQNGHGQVVEQLLAAGADPDDGGADNPPLIQAAAQDQVDMFSLLVDGGADVDIRDQSRREWTALMWAANNGNLDGVTALLALGADPGLQATDDRTASEIAADLGYTEVVNQLSSAG